MTNRNIIKIFAVALFALGMQSCNDFLDTLPDERTEIDSEDKVQKLLMTSYPDANYSWIAELSSDNLLDNQTPHMPSNPNKKQVSSYYNYSSYSRFDDQLYRFDMAKDATYGDYDSPGAAWSGYYSSIATCNYALEALEELKNDRSYVPTDKAKALRAEAQILRAYNHFCLVNLFSQAYKNEEQSKKDVGVTYMTKPETTAVAEYDRDNVYNTYKAIEKDLEEALPNLSENYTKAEAMKYHFNSRAAHAFAARFYLYTRQWQKVVDHANEVLGTDSASIVNMTMDYTGFDDCSSLDDYAKVWQNPNQNNNLLLLVTGSLLQRRTFGYRYSLAGEKCQEVLLVRTSNSLWNGYICPVQAVVGGMLFGSSSKDYGFFNSKIGEEFQYSDKLAGIGYPHIIMRAFTGNELLLERAEAKLMLGDIEGCSEDLCYYWNSAFWRFSEKNQTDFKANYKFLTDDLIRKNYTQTFTTSMEGVKKANKVNCYEDWNFTQTNVSPDYVIPAEAVPYMNCINEFRRFENAFEGLRFFDLKRWGIPYEHVQGSSADKYVMEGIDSKRALEPAWEVLSAGLESSRGTVEASKQQFTLDAAALKSNN